MRKRLLSYSRSQKANLLTDGVGLWFHSTTVPPLSLRGQACLCLTLTPRGPGSPKKPLRTGSGKDPTPRRERFLWNDATGTTAGAIPRQHPQPPDKTQAHWQDQHPLANLHRSHLKITFAAPAIPTIYRSFSDGVTPNWKAWPLHFSYPCL